MQTNLSNGELPYLLLQRATWRKAFEMVERGPEVQFPSALAKSEPKYNTFLNAVAWLWQLAQPAETISIPANVYPALIEGTQLPDPIVGYQYIGEAIADGFMARDRYGDGPIVYRFRLTLPESVARHFLVVEGNK